MVSLNVCLTNLTLPGGGATGSPTVVRGSIGIQSGVLPTDSPSRALYVTARPDRPDNVPAAILSGTRGKPPPIAAARFFPAPTFPFAFELTEEDLTEEGAAQLATDSSRWWIADDLVVSARLDSDGRAATRDPEDLVGRALLRRRQGQSQGGGGGGIAAARPVDLSAPLELQGRGIGGKFVTSKKK